MCQRWFVPLAEFHAQLLIGLPYWAYLAWDMPFSARIIETRIATMALVDEGFIEQRFKSGERVDLAGFAENKAARYELAGELPHVMLSVIPRDMDFDVSVTRVDHFAPERDRDLLRALAVVVNDNMSEMVTKLFFSYFPTVFHTQVFSDEASARVWLHAQVAEIAQENA